MSEGTAARAIAILKDSGGTPVPGAVVQFAQWAVNGGWTYSVTGMEAFDLDQDRFAWFTITLKDGWGNTRTTPKLLITNGSERDTRNTEGAGLINFSGEDDASYRLRTPNQNYPSFLATDSATLVDTLATSVGVVVEDAPSQYITEEDVKGEKPEEAIARIRQAYAYETVVAESGQVVFSAWEDSADTIDWDWSNRERTLNKTQVYTGVRIGKTSSMPDGDEQLFSFTLPGEEDRTLSPPLLSPASDISLCVVGSIGAATYYNEASEIVQHDYYHPDYATPLGSFGTGPAVSVHVIVLPGVGPESESPVDAVLRVVGDPYDEGDPPPSGVDREFLYPAAGVSLGAWPAPDNIIEPLFPGLSYGMTRHPHILDRLNSAADTLKMDGIFYVGTGIGLRYRHAYAGKNYKAMSIRWDVASARTSIEYVRITSDG